MQSKIKVNGNKLITTIAKNTYSSWALALQALKPIFDALTDEQKYSSYIVRGTQIYRCTDTVSGVFSASGASIRNNAVIMVSQTFFLDEEKYIRGEITSSGYTSADYSANAQTLALSLYVFE